MHYYNFKETLQGKAQLVTLDQLKKLKTDPDKDYYLSIYKYNDEHKAKFDQTGSVAGIKDVVSDVLVWDFDSKDDLNQAQSDTVELASRLVELGVDPDNIACYLSGNKGLHVVLPIGYDITPAQFKKATTELAKGLKTYDSVVSDPQRVLRMEHTKHPKTGLYKIPLHINEVDQLDSDALKELAKTPRLDFERVIKPSQLPSNLFEIKEKKVKQVLDNKSRPDFSRKPRGMNEYTYALLEGFYEAGERHQALLILAAKYRALGYDKEATYHICKSSLKKQARRTGTDDFDKKELWDNILEDSIYTDTWQGGSFSPKNNEWLQKYCDRYSIKWDSISDSNIMSAEEAFDVFERYATNIDALTIKSGIEELDRKLRLTVGMSVGLVASPGVGKTSVILQILHNMSKEGHRCIFFSYDMYAPIVYQKLVQKHLNIYSDDVFTRFNTDPAFKQEVKDVIAREYSKVTFCFKTGQTVEDILDTIKETEEATGEKVKFIGMDYNELVITDYSDPTQSSSFVAQKMREIAQSMEMCVFSLFQPSKISGTPADEIKSYNSAKGSGAIAQSVTVMLGMSRPGYNPQNPDNDIFTNLCCLKNRMGPLFSIDFHWEGFTGTISTLSDEDRMELKKIRDEKKLVTVDNAWGS